MSKRKAELALQIFKKVKEVDAEREESTKRKPLVKLVADKIKDRLHDVFSGNGTVFDPADGSFALPEKNRYIIVLVEESQIKRDKSFITCGAIIPFAPSVGRYKPASPSESGTNFEYNSIMSKHADKIGELNSFVEGMRQYTFLGITELGLEDMSVVVEGVKYYLALYSEFSLHHAGNLLDWGLIVPCGGFVADKSKAVED